jgi:hypothetical protein
LKKLLSTLLGAAALGLVTGGYFVWERFSKNPEQIVPFPYTFSAEAPAVTLDAPILIVGDRMGVYFSKFSAGLAETISQNLAKPIRVQSIARAGEGLHRTLHALRSLSQWPQIVIYHGASEEFAERKFELAETNRVRANFARYQDDRVETLLILYPWLSRLAYEPVKRVVLPPAPLPNDQDEAEYLKRLDTELLLFEQQLLRLVAMSKDRNSLLILTTTPINLDEPPRKTCDVTATAEIDAEILTLRELLKRNNPKEAYTKSAKLVARYPGNAELLYLHGQVAKRLGNVDEAVDTLLSASAYDCGSWRATAVHNSIIRRVARVQQVLLFDFARLTENDFTENTTFFDEIHPQNLYYDRGVQQLGLVIKQILKL